MISQISNNLMPLHTFVVHSREKEMYSNATWTKGVCELELMRLVAEMTALNKVIVYKSHSEPFLSFLRNRIWDLG